MESNTCIPILKALSDKTRLEIVRALLQSKCTVQQLAEQLNIPHYNASKHLRILREAGIVVVHARGASRICSLSEKILDRQAGSQNVLNFGCCKFEFGRDATRRNPSSDSSGSSQSGNPDDTPGLVTSGRRGETAGTSLVSDGFHYRLEPGHPTDYSSLSM